MHLLFYINSLASVYILIRLLMNEQSCQDLHKLHFLNWFNALLKIKKLRLPFVIGLYTCIVA